MMFGPSRFIAAFAGVASLFVPAVSGLGDTDTITWGGDVSRAGYQTNHNMDPAIVGSPSFGQIFKAKLPGNFNGIGPEQIFSQPLVYTGGDGFQYLYVATTQNNIYKLDAKTGNIVAKRNLWVPFLTADLDGCVDINPTVGVTATGVIDGSTGIWYFTAKTYSSAYQSGNFGPNNPPGRLNGRYYFHAINTADLTDAFAPTPVEGTTFRNNPNRMFISGNQHQRPALLQVDDFVYTGWASHCVKWNFTGAIIGFHRSTGQIVEAFTTEGGSEPNTVPGGGVWMSGGGLAYDGRGSMYFATGNGYASQLAATGQAVPGRNPPTALEEAAVNAKINDNGTISVIDFFMPWEKTQLDGADKDLGTTPLEILPSAFSCPNHPRIGVVTGKSGKTYWLNLNDLGGYQMAGSKADNVIQVYQNENSVYAGAGVMPLGGGYIYINVIQYQTHVFKFSCSPSGNAVFSKVADTPEKNANILGVGHGTTTSLNGQEGTGLLWVSDVEGYNLRIYDPIPPSGGGNLKLLNYFNIPGVTKFSRPVFGDGRAYIGTTLGFLYGFGSPVSLPLNCSSPYSFSNTAIGSTSPPVNVTCVANVQTTINSIALTGNANFNLSNIPATPFNVQQGDSFGFTAVFAPKTVGLLSSDVAVASTNGGTGYSGNTPFTLKGTANSAKPLLQVRPNTVSFNTIVGQGSDDQSVILANNGDSALTISKIAYSQTSENGPTIAPNTTSEGYKQVGPFVLKNIPSSIPPNSVAPITISYVPAIPANDAVFLNISSDGGSSLLDVLGTAGSQPMALFEFQTPDTSGWVPYTPGSNFTFGKVTENTIRNLKFRVTNNGSSSAAPLSITVSKPPYGVPGIVGAANNVDLAEGTNIPAGQSQTAMLYCSPPKSPVNLPGYSQTVQWTINTGDPNLGKLSLNFTCNAVSEQVGPLFSNGTAQYGYVGCAYDQTPGRQLSNQIYADNTNNTNGKCISACAAAGYIFAGTEYNSECWCGNSIPNSFGTDADCNYQCTGDSRQSCGGNGIAGNASLMSLFADGTKFNGNRTSPPLQIVQSYKSYSFQACYAESGGKALNGKATNSNAMTIESCGDFCTGFSMFGVEYGQECYCGNTLVNSPTVTANSQCGMTCAGSNSEYCGAGNRMLVYVLQSTTTSSSSASSSSSTSTSAAVVTTSVASSSTGTSTTLGSSTSSTTTLATDASASTTTNLAMSSSTTSSGPAAPTNIGSWTLQGCFVETAGRLLQKKGKSDSTISDTSCATFCAGSLYFGTEYGQECYCGDSLSSAPVNATDGRCNMPCAADPNQICGGPSGLTLYQSSTYTGPSVVLAVGRYASAGCYSEGTSTRALAQTFADDGMTIELCNSTAASAGAAIFGVEYGRECWYGNTLADGSAPIAQSRCDKLCSGNSTEYCGGGNALQLYTIAPTASASSTSSVSTQSSTIATTTSSSSTTSSTSATATSSSSTTATTSMTATTTSSTSTTSTTATTTSLTSTTSTTSSTSTISATSSTTTSATSSTATPKTSSTTTSTTSSSTTSSSTSSSTSSTTATTLITTTSSSTISSATVSQTPLTCPQSNGTVWNAQSGASYLIECDTDHQAGDLKMVYKNSYEECISICDVTTGCVDVSLNGKACYMKKTVGKSLVAKNIRGAKLLYNSQTYTLTSSSSTTSVVYTTTITAGPTSPAATTTTKGN